MEKKRSSCLQLPLVWALGAGLALVPAVLISSALAQQPAPAATDQQPDWGQAGPPPDAQNGQVPAPQNAQNPQQQAQPGDQGDWGPAGPPPDAQNGQVPPPQNQQNTPPVGYGQRAPYTGEGYRNQEATAPSGPVTISKGIFVEVRTSGMLDPKKLQPGDYFQGTVAQNVYVGNVLAIPRGAQVTGRVVDVKKAGELKGSSGLTLQLTDLNLGGEAYSLATDTWSSNGPGKGAYTASNTVGTAALGAVIGAIAGGGPGAAIGAVAGTGVGLGASAATSGPRGVIPPEAVLTFQLTAPLTVQPVSYQQARQLEAQSAPVNERYAPRPGFPPSPYGSPSPYGYGYPPPPNYYAPYPYAYPYAYAYPYPYPYGYAYGYPYRYYRYWR